MTETTIVDSTELPDATSIIRAIAKGDVVGAGTSFEDIMDAKKQAALELRKQDFAGQLFNPPVQEPVEEPAVEEE